MRTAFVRGSVGPGLHRDILAPPARAAPPPRKFGSRAEVPPSLERQSIWLEHHVVCATVSFLHHRKALETGPFLFTRLATGERRCKRFCKHHS